MPSQTILLKKQDAVATITMNRPEVLNAFNSEMRRALMDALKDVEKDKTTRTIILTGAGRAFCAGQDLGDLKTFYEKGGAPDFGRLLTQDYNPIIMKIRTMDKPIIASVSGSAAGAGMSIALACDFRIVSEKASFYSAFINVGLAPDTGATLFLTRYLGLARASEIALQGEKLTAENALQLGLATKVTPPDQLEKETWDFATKLARMPTKGIGLTKRTLNKALYSSLEETLEYEASIQTIAGMTHDHKEGVKAFLEKREPQFRGE